MTEFDPRPEPGRAPARWRGVARGLAAAAVLVITAADALFTAWAGIPPLAWLARRAARVLGEEYRRARHDAIDAEVIEDPADSPAPGAGEDGR